MDTIKFSSEYFNAKDTLLCGQIFRYLPYKKGYLIFSLDKCAYCYTENDYTYIISNDKEYFYNYFDLKKDYSIIYNSIKTYGDFITKIATLGKGIRLLKQDITENLFSFIISQNNNIPRIKGIIERLCENLGEKRFLNEIEYYSFPSVDKMSEMDVEFYKSIGLGYRAPYIKRLAEDIKGGLDLNSFNNLSTKSLKIALNNLYGVGPKVTDCVTLFGFNRGDSFPVDTWIEKVYKENFNGTLSDRKKISEWFINKFGENSGIIQQYLFYYKRSLERL